MADTKEKDEVAITRLELKVGSEKVRPTIEQARELYEALAKLFGPKVEVRVEKEYIYWPRPIYYWSQPGQASPSWICKTDNVTGDGVQSQFVGTLSLEVK